MKLSGSRFLFLGRVLIALSVPLLKIVLFILSFSFLFSLRGLYVSRNSLLYIPDVTFSYNSLYLCGIHCFSALISDFIRTLSLLKVSQFYLFRETALNFTDLFYFF